MRSKNALQIKATSLEDNETALPPLKEGASFLHTLIMQFALSLAVLQRENVKDNNPISKKLQCSLSLPFKKRKIPLLSSHPFKEGEGQQLTATTMIFAVSFAIVVKCGFFSGTLLLLNVNVYAANINIKDIVYKHLQISTLCTLSLFSIYPDIAYLPIFGTKAHIHTICTLPPFAAFWGILVAFFGAF